MKLWFFRIRKTKRERYQEWRNKRRQEQADLFKASLDKLYLGRFLTYLAPHRSRIAQVLILSLVGGVIGLVLPFSARFILNVIVPRGDYYLLHLVILSALGAYLSYAFLRYWEQKLVITLSLSVVTDIRKDLFQHQLNLPISYFEKYSTGKLISRLTYSIFMVKMLLERFAYVCFREIVLIAMVVVAASFIEWRLTLILLGLTPLLILYVRRLNTAMALVAERLQTKNDEILRILDRTFHSIKLFQIFGEAERETTRFHRVLAEDQKYRIKRTLAYAVNSIVITFLSSAVLLATLWYGGRQVILGHLQYGDVVGYLLCLGILFRPIGEFVRACAYYQAGKMGIRTIFSIFDNTSTILPAKREIRPERREGAIEFRNVWFRYGNGYGGLKNVSFSIQPGQKVLIVGPSGSGKSTLFNLLMRFYDADRGSVVIDGVNIRRMALADLRSYFSVVTQENLHFEDSILNNVLLGNGPVEEEEGEPEERLERAIEIAQKTGMGRFITSLNRKYGEKIGHGGGAGRNFSQGELQKFAIMRAVSRGEAPIVLLDEPLTALDHFSQKEISRILEEQFRGKTRLIISHTPLSFLRPDWILVLKNGWIEAQGNHHYLVKHSHYYRRLMGRPTAVGADI